jgi:hypothetical protein
MNFLKHINSFVYNYCEWFNTDPRGSIYDGATKALLFTGILLILINIILN